MRVAAIHHGCVIAFRFVRRVTRNFEVTGYLEYTRVSRVSETGPEPFVCEVARKPPFFLFTGLISDACKHFSCE